MVVWFARVFLFFMGFTYLAIGVWAILDPLLRAVELGYPSFLDAVGLTVTSEIGYSEIAGLYGGLNIVIGIMCFIGIFNKQISFFIIRFLAMLVGSIALGRVIFSLLPTTPTFINSFFIFEVVGFVICIFLIKNYK
ncbi:hypothetical protein N9H95_04250 [Gammaproteobacteria bacterium]|nr:hypothetical protein [Gammaproteobacteria bacterium]MDA8957642.1 hypothetical protein [Gammaproteobacteria bacterium]MDA9024459.1 hypothetical protein [Gammaproteobacteria bacterium]MDA9039089.1 hypothetical protein [Gammaproteobacteria bacterium]MDA9045088.1 hypothetical protein [Gammaproteobacteria bacterium]|tara:strand:+ start:5602 stop:6009 length:408 start_codon:yes stop_codon:yes gene_type:complete